MGANRKHSAPHAASSPPAPAPPPRPPIRPEDLFRAEKARVTSAARSQHARLLAEAKAAFDKLMAEGQAARKSGRPRKHPLPPLKTGSALRQPPPAFARPAVAMPVASTPKPAPKPVAPAKNKKPRVSGAKRNTDRTRLAGRKAKARPRARVKTLSGARLKARSKKRR